MRVCINPGHAPNGVPDPGAVNIQNGEVVARECDFALTAGQMLERYLNEAGIETTLIQSDDLNEVCRTSDNFEADLFVSLHCNAANGQARGTEVWYKSASGGNLATCIQNQIVNSINTVDRGTKQTDSLWVLNDTNATACLVEMAFIDNDEDLEMMKDNLDTIVRAIARGVTDYQIMYL